MRLYLLPISTRRTLIYCDRMSSQLNAERTYIDKITNKANETWAAWERSDGGWKKQLTVYGNKVLRRIPFEEWGLKTIPALSEARKEALLGGKEDKVEVIFPGRFVRAERVPKVLEALATERQGLHRKRLLWSLIGMPISAPFGLIPVVPNVPFFYLAFRAYSHWKALAGSKHLEFLCRHALLTYSPSATLDASYATGLLHPTRPHAREAAAPPPEKIDEVARIVEQQTNAGTEDVMVLQRWNGKLIAERFKLPEMEVEIERAVEQVEQAIKTRAELTAEKEELQRANEALNKEVRENDRVEKELQAEVTQVESEEAKKEGRRQ